MNLLTIVKNTDIVKKIRSVTVTAFSIKDVRNAPEAAPYGIDSNPVAGMQALYIKTSNDSQPVICGYINTQQLAATGENRIYATDAGGNEVGKVWLHTDGTVELAGVSDSVNANHAAQFEGLQTAFNQLTTDYGNFVTAFNAHVHGGSGTPPTPVPGVIPVTDTTADISPAKATKILIP